MDEVARLLTLLALLGGAMTLLGGACVWFLDEAIPRNASGKFLKRQLRETLKPEAAV